MFVEIDGAPIFFDTVGARLEPQGAAMVERPTLLVLHGGPGFDHSLMRPWFDRFADTHQVVYVDHRGNGRSGGAPTPGRWPAGATTSMRSAGFSGSIRPPSLASPSAAWWRCPTRGATRRARPG